MMKTPELRKYRLFLAVLGLTAGTCCAQAFGETPFDGLSAMVGSQRANPYITAGDRSYVIGTQNGDFPDLGGHVPGEMGGIWAHPIKLLDGFWLKVTAKGEEAYWLNRATRYTTYPDRSEFEYETGAGRLSIKQMQFCPEGMPGVVVHYTITNHTQRAMTIEADFIVKTDLSPVWFSKENGIHDYTDLIHWEQDDRLCIARDSVNSWYCAWGSPASDVLFGADAPTPVPTAGQGRSAALGRKLKIKAGEKAELTYVIAGSDKSQDAAVVSYRSIGKDWERLLEKKQDKYAELLNHAAIRIPDKELERVYDWVKINTRWLVSDLPGEGRFLGAGAIEYPWLFGCDNSYALQGVAMSMGPALVGSTLRLLQKKSEQANGNGRILHEMSSNGYVANPGNTQETAHYILAVWNTYKWSGDTALLRDLYPYMKKGIEWLLTTRDRNGNLFPEGPGIMEVQGLDVELIDVAVYTQQALEAMSQMAAELGEPAALVSAYREKADTLKKRINTLFWDNSEGLYGDFFGSKEQMLNVCKGAMHQLETYRREGFEVSEDKISYYKKLAEKAAREKDHTQRCWFSNKNWVISTPLEVGIAPRERALDQLDKVREYHCSEFGPYLSAVERLRNMTIATGVQAVAEARYGRIEESVAYMRMIGSTLGRTLPGSINEMMPDYGCPAQAWTIYGIAVPILSELFGINPHASKKVVVLQPNIPEGWDELSVDNLAIGTNTLHYELKQTDKEISIILRDSEPGWTYRIDENFLGGRTLHVDHATLPCH